MDCRIIKKLFHQLLLSIFLLSYPLIAESSEQYLLEHLQGVSFENKSNSKEQKNINDTINASFKATFLRSSLLSFLRFVKVNDARDHLANVWRSESQNKQLFLTEHP
jgi:hypothetical protein